MSTFIDNGYVRSSATDEGTTHQLWDTNGNMFSAGAAAITGVGGYKIARGTVTPTSASHTVVTGLTTVVACIVSFKGAPALTHTIVAGDVGNQSGAPAAGSILVKSYKPTSTTDTTPVAATTPWSVVDWIAIGT